MTPTKKGWMMEKRFSVGNLLTILFVLVTVITNIVYTQATMNFHIDNDPSMETLRHEFVSIDLAEEQKSSLEKRYEDFVKEIREDLNYMRTRLDDALDQK